MRAAVSETDERVLAALGMRKRADSRLEAAIIPALIHGLVVALITFLALMLAAKFAMLSTPKIWMCLSVQMVFTGVIAIIAIQKLKETNAFLCPYCEKLIPADLEWTCGYCGTKNQGIGDYSFFNCSRGDCRREAPGYICHHSACQKRIWFQEKQTGHLAMKYEEPLPGETQEEADERRVAANARRVKLAESEEAAVKAEAKRDATINASKQTTQTAKTEEEQIKDLHRRIALKIIAEDDGIEEARRIFLARYGNNPTVVEEKLRQFEAARSRYVAM